MTLAQDLLDAHLSLPLPHQCWDLSVLTAFSAAYVSQQYAWGLELSWARKTWVRLVLGVRFSGFGCPPLVEVPGESKGDL